MYYLYWPLVARSMILKNLIFPLHFFIYSKEAFFTHSTNWIPNNIDRFYAQQGLCLKKAIVMSWPIIYHVILLVIIFNNILLILPIVFTYYFIPDGLYFWYIKPNLSIFEKRIFYIVLLKSAWAIILFIKKRIICHFTLLRLAFSLLLFHISQLLSS